MAEELTVFVIGVLLIALPKLLASYLPTASAGAPDPPAEDRQDETAVRK